MTQINAILRECLCVAFGAFQYLRRLVRQYFAVVALALRPRGGGLEERVDAVDEHR